MPGVATITTDDAPIGRAADDLPVPALVIAWSAAQPASVGEVALVTGSSTLGRGEGGPEHLSFVRQRPGASSPGEPLEGPGISRRQLRLRPRGEAIAVEQLGRCPMRVNGQACERAVLVAGDTLALRGQLLLVCVARPPTLPPLAHFDLAHAAAFGAPDAFGLVGESPSAWELREQLAFAGRAGVHTLVVGETGSGKELAANAIHRLSARAARPFVARNAATIPSGLVDAELFGNLKSYPNAGMNERVGLVGEASGGTLFLDEIGELAPELQAHLLRLLDRGEYHRLGESATRRADLRLIGATNRDPTELKHDLLPRLALRVEVPPLSERLEDLPLLLRHLLGGIVRRSPEVAARLVDDEGELADPSLVEELLHTPLPGNVRDVEAAIWAALGAKRGAPAKPADGPVLETAVVAPPPVPLTTERIVAVLEEERGNLVRASRRLRLPSRYALYRLLRKHGIALDQIRPGRTSTPPSR